MDYLATKKGLEYLLKTYPNFPVIEALEREQAYQDYLESKVEDYAGYI
jgi:hypothetical protein